MAGGRFVVLYRDPETIVTLGLVGQFWKLSGGGDTDIPDANAFVAFKQPGFVKSAIDLEFPQNGSPLKSARSCPPPTSIGSIAVRRGSASANPPGRTALTALTISATDPTSS